MTVQDLGTQFFLREADLTKARDQVSASRLAELNAYVPISIVKNLKTEIEKFQVIFVF